MKKSSLQKLWSAGVGSMDAVTGLLLLLAPLHTLRLLGISPPSPDAMVFLGWIGVFVMSIGLSYGLAVLRPGYVVPVWIFTSLVRAAVAGFVMARILDGSLEVRWIVVALTDAAIACTQIFILRTGCWKELLE